MSAQRQHSSGTGWIVFSAILLILAGTNMFLNGLFALHANGTVQKNVKDTLLFSGGNLDTWGWIYVIIGAVVFIAGFAVFVRAQWAVFVGLFAAWVAIVMAFFWLFTPYWPDAIVSIILEGLVIHGLGTYGLQEYTTA